MTGITYIRVLELPLKIQCIALPFSNVRPWPDILLRCQLISHFYVGFKRSEHRNSFKPLTRALTSNGTSCLIREANDVVEADEGLAADRCAACPRGAVRSPSQSSRRQTGSKREELVLLLLQGSCVLYVFFWF